MKPNVFIYSLAKKPTNFPRPEIELQWADNNFLECQHLGESSLKIRATIDNYAELNLCFWAILILCTLLIFVHKSDSRSVWPWLSLVARILSDKFPSAAQFSVGESCWVFWATLYYFRRSRLLQRNGDHLGLRFETLQQVGHRAGNTRGFGENSGRIRQLWKRAWSWSNWRDGMGR